MKILCCGDWHLTTKCPVNRKENYNELQRKKVEWILRLASEKGCNTILQAGDFFNSPVEPYSLIGWLLSLLVNSGSSYDHFFSVYGQHDLRYHSSSIENTPLSLLTKSLRVTSLGGYGIGHKNISGVKFSGVSWGEPVPAIDEKANVNILLIHKMIVEDKPLFPDQKDYISGRRFLESHKYDLVVSGDNHKGFLIKHNNSVLFNAGSLMRSNIDQKDHKPSVLIYDVLEKSYERYHIPIEPADDVFVLKKHLAETGEEYNSYVKGLNTDFNVKGLDFLQQLDIFLKSNSISKKVEECIHSIIRKEQYG